MAVDNVLMKGKWEFNSEVTSCFPDMLNRSIPGYDDMRHLCYTIGKKFVKPGKTIVDIGCSTGLAVEPFLKHWGGEDYRYLLMDVSEPMIEECRKKFKTYTDSGIMTIKNASAVDEYEGKNVCLAMSIFTLQFIPIEHRQKVIANLYDSLEPGGAFILAEKVLGTANDTNELLVDRYYLHKFEQGYSKDQIANKKKALENVLVPLKAEWDEDLLKTAGFRYVEQFWQSLNFAAWVAIK